MCYILKLTTNFCKHLIKTETNTELLLNDYRMMARCIALVVTVMLAVACVASPLSGDTAVSTNESTPQADGTLPETRVRRSPHPEDQRELISRQILQALSGTFL